MRGKVGEPGRLAISRRPSRANTGEQGSELLLVSPHPPLGWWRPRVRARACGSASGRGEAG